MVPRNCGFRKVALLCLLVSVRESPADDLSTPREYEGRPIESVRFEPRRQPLTSADLARAVNLPRGAPLRQDDIRDAIKRLYATGEYRDIEVTWEPSSAGVTLVFHTREQWFVGPVEVRGKIKLPPNSGQLANASRLELGTAFYEEEDLQPAVRRIQSLMERNGLYQSTVAPKIERDSEHRQVSLTFQVESGHRARLELPAITGDTRIPPEEATKGAKYKGWFRWKKATAETVQNGLMNIRKRYSKEDRLTASVTMRDRKYDPATNRVKPTINADGGPKVKIVAEGAKVSKGNLQKYVPVFDEETVNRDLLVRGAGNLRDYFQNKGYFEAQVDFRNQNIDADHEQITFLITPGERHKLVKIDIVGNRYFTTQAIRDRMFLEESGFIRLRHGRYSEGFVRRDREAIEALYKDTDFAT